MVLLTLSSVCAGPAVSVDTACSSVLVSTNMAMQHIGNVGAKALSAGVNLILAEHTTAAAQVEYVFLH